MISWAAGWKLARPFETLQLCWCLFKCKHLSVSFSPCQQRNLYLDKKKRFKDKIWKLSDTNYRNIDIQTFLVVKLKAARWVDLESRFVESCDRKSDFLATEWVSWKWIRGVAVDVEWKMCDAVVFPRKEVENVAVSKNKSENWWAKWWPAHKFSRSNPDDAMR